MPKVKIRLCSLALAAWIGAALPCAAAAQEAGIEQALREIDLLTLADILRKHFSEEDIDSLAKYFKDSMAGRTAQLPEDLLRRFQQAMGEIRLEYGFQVALLLSELKKYSTGPFKEGLQELEKSLDPPE